MILTKSAIILSKFYAAGTEIECTESTAEAGYKAFERAAVREKITENTGFDDASLLGITNDGVHVLTYAIATLYVAIADASTLDDVKAKIAAFTPFATDFLEKVESGEVNLPYLVNANKGGVAGVFTSVSIAANGTTAALAEVST